MFGNNHLDGVLSHFLSQQSTKLNIRGCLLSVKYIFKVDHYTHNCKKQQQY